MGVPERGSRDIRQAAILATFLLFVGSTSALFGGQGPRYFMAECGGFANFIKLSANGKYEAISRDDFGLSVDDKGRWNQEQDIITFNSTDARDGPYQGIEVRYKDRVFIAWKSGNPAQITMPVRDTERELDRDPKSVPPYVFFEIAEDVYKRETKKSTVLHYIKAH